MASGPSSRAPALAALAVGAVAALTVLLPPETDGTAFAGIAALSALAALLGARLPELPRAACWLAPVALVAALRARFADAPGEALAAVVVPLLAAALGCAAAAAARASSLAAPRLRAVAIAGACVVGARAVYEVAFGLRQLADRVRTDPSLVPDASLVLGRLEQGRAYAGFPTPAAAGACLALVLPLTVGWTIAARGRWRYLLGAAAAVQLAGLAATRSLTAAGALLVAVALGAAAMRSRTMLVAAGGLLAVVAAIAATRSGQIFSRATDDSPTALRAGNARVAVAIAGDHPWWGVGPGGFGEAFPHYRRVGDNASRHAHVAPLEWMAEWGIPAGSVLSLAFLAVFAWPLAAPAAARGALERGAAIGLAAFALQNLGDFTVTLPSVLGLACVLRGTLAGGPGAGGAPERGARLAFATAACAVAALAVASGLSEAEIDRGRMAAAEGDAGRASLHAVRAARLAPWSGNAAMLAAAATGALPDADRAVALLPARAAARFLRARARAARADLPGAVADLDRAIELNPLRPDYRAERDRLAPHLPGVR